MRIVVTLETDSSRSHPSRHLRIALVAILLCIRLHLSVDTAFFTQPAKNFERVFSWKSETWFQFWAPSLSHLSAPVCFEYIYIYVF